MERYKFRIVLDVEVEAFDEGDAADVVEETFGLGDDCGVLITESEVSYLGTDN